MQTGRIVGPPFRQESRIVAASISPDASRVVTIAEDGQARLWNTTGGQPVGAPLTDRGGIGFARFSPDGRRLLTASKENTARVWDRERPAGRRRASAALRRGHVGRVQLGRLARRDGCHESRRSSGMWTRASSSVNPCVITTTCCRSASAGTAVMVVTASRDHTARVWDAGTGEPNSEPLRHEGPVRHAEFSASGRHVVTASDDGTARVWDLLNGSPAEAGVLASLAEAVAGFGAHLARRRRPGGATRLRGSRAFGRKPQAQADPAHAPSSAGSWPTAAAVRTLRDCRDASHFDGVASAFRRASSERPESQSHLSVARPRPPCPTCPSRPTCLTRPARRPTRPTCPTRPTRPTCLTRRRRELRGYRRVKLRCTGKLTTGR